MTHCSPAKPVRVRLTRRRGKVKPYLDRLGGSNQEIKMRHPINYQSSDDPHIVFALILLKDAKQDAQMWADFNEEFPTWNPNYTSLDIAAWVGNWLKRHPEEAKLKDVSRADVKAMNKYFEEQED